MKLKVTPDLRGCPRGKDSYARHCGGKQGKLYIVGGLDGCGFLEKNMNCRFLRFRKRGSQTTTKMTMCHSIELIGYQIQAHWQNNCTVLITKDQSSKVVSIFRYSDWLFLINLSSSSSKEYPMGIALKIVTGEIL